MRGSSGKTTMTKHDIGNLRFLIEHQLEVISTLERQGLDLNDASDLLGKLMRRDEETRRRMNGAQPLVSFDGAVSRPRKPFSMCFIPDGSSIPCGSVVPAV